MLQEIDIDLSKLKVSFDRKEVFDSISKELDRESLILSARVYGSSLLTWSRNPDVDLAVMVRSNQGIVLKDDYVKLKRIRQNLVDETGCDIDLITHTEDEVIDQASPLWNARYYPSLINGIDLKSTFEIPNKVNTYQDTAGYVLHDNRTITRRQLLRENGQGNWRIFISKLIHGPGNAITYLHLHDRYPELVNPSDVPLTFQKFDEIYGSDSSCIQSLFIEGREKIRNKEFGFDDGVYLMNWYEALVTKVLYE